MERNQLEGTLYWKIGCELKLFKYRIMQGSKEEILAEAYKISTIIAIYECLVEQIGVMTNEMLSKLLYCSNLLECIFERWLKIEDSFNTELSMCIDEVLFDFSKKENMICQI